MNAFHLRQAQRFAIVCMTALTIPSLHSFAFADEPTAQASTPTTNDADKLFQQGVDARKAGNLAEAEGFFGSAWEIKKTWDIAANLGLVELNLGKTAEGANHVHYAIMNLPPTESDSTRERLVKAFEVAKPKVGALDVQCDVDGAEVRIGGKVHGTTPVRLTLFVVPGPTTIDVKKDGYLAATKTVTVEAGGSVSLSFLLVKETPPERSFVPAGIAFGAGAAGLLLGIVTGGASIATFADLKKACGDDVQCPAKFRGDVDAGKTLSHVSTAGFVVAGVGAAVGVSLLLVPIGRRPPVAAGLMFGPGFVGLKGTF